MPETPDFDAIRAADSHDRRLCRLESQQCAGVRHDAEDLRQVWNARGAADIATLEAVLPNLTTVKLGAMKTIDAALRALDR